MKKLYDHLDQFRDGMQNAAESAVKPIYRQFFFEVIPFMLISIVMNSFILSGVRSPLCAVRDTSDHIILLHSTLASTLSALSTCKSTSPCSVSAYRRR